MLASQASTSLALQVLRSTRTEGTLQDATKCQQLAELMPKSSHSKRHSFTMTVFEVGTFLHSVDSYFS